MKRLVIYFHYDPAGCIDTACRIAVQAVQKYGRVVFVTNGTLAPADRVWVRQSGAGRIERENVGFDVGAYREALLTLGREKLAEASMAWKMAARSVLRLWLPWAFLTTLANSWLG